MSALAAGCGHDTPALRAPAEVKLDSGRLQRTFVVEANMAWTASFDDPSQDWCSVTPLAGDGFKSTLMTVTATENPDTVRSTIFSIMLEGTPPMKVKITQGLSAVVYFSNASDAKQPKGTFTVNEVAEGAALPTFNNINLETPYPAVSDRQILLDVSSPDGEKGVLYDYDAAEAVIKAGETSTTFPVKGIYVGFPSDTATLVVSITGGSFVPVRFNQTYTLTIVRGKSLTPAPTPQEPTTPEEPTDPGESF